MRIRVLGIVLCSALTLSLAGCKKGIPLFKSLTSVQTNIDFSNNIIESEEFNINQYLYAHNGGGVSIGDFNNDGLADIFFTANQLANRLYLNNGDFTFDDVTKSSGISGLVGKEYWTTGSTVIDINNDGWLDIYVNQVSNLKALKGRNQLFINNGDGTFTDKAKQYGLALETYSQQAVFFD